MRYIANFLPFTPVHAYTLEKGSYRYIQAGTKGVETESDQIANVVLPVLHYEGVSQVLASDGTTAYKLKGLFHWYDGKQWQSQNAGAMQANAIFAPFQYNDDNIFMVTKWSRIVQDTVLPPSLSEVFVLPATRRVQQPPSTQEVEQETRGGGAMVIKSRSSHHHQRRDHHQPQKQQLRQQPPPPINSSHSSDSTLVVAERLTATEAGVVKIFGTQTCRYCTYAKTLLDDKGIKYSYHQVEELRTNPQMSHCAALVPKSWKTVPMIIWDGKWIGGFKELQSHLTSQKQGSVV